MNIKITYLTKKFSNIVSMLTPVIQFFQTYGQLIVSWIFLGLSSLSLMFHKVMNVLHGWLCFTFLFAISLYCVILAIKNKKLKKQNYHLDRDLKKFTHRVEFSGYFWDFMGQPYCNHEGKLLSAKLLTINSEPPYGLQQEEGTNGYLEIWCPSCGDRGYPIDRCISYKNVAISQEKLYEILKKLHGEYFIEYNVSIEDEVTEDIPF